MTLQTLEKFIEEGEHQEQDFKHTIGDKQKIAKTLVAFANTNGGRLLVGVKDNGKVIGTEPEAEKYMLDYASKDFCKPPIPIKYTEFEVGSKKVLLAEIEKSISKPHYALGEDDKWWVYVRVGDECLLATKVMVEVMILDTKEAPSKMTFGEPEKMLLSFLEENEVITTNGFCKLSKINRWKAHRILVNLIRMKVIKVVRREGLDFYSL